MRLYHEDQTIVVSGERYGLTSDLYSADSSLHSGAGKSFTAGQLIENISKSSTGEFQASFKQAYSILETFGNASTTRNTNSSRSGQLTKVSTVDRPYSIPSRHRREADVFIIYSLSSRQITSSGQASLFSCWNSRGLLDRTPTSPISTSFINYSAVPLPNS